MDNSSKRPPFPKRTAAALVIGILTVSVIGFVAMRFLFPGFTDKLFPSGKSTPVPIPINNGNAAQSVDSSGIQAADFNLALRLSEGKAQPQSFVPVPLATGEPLTPEEIQQILARLPDLPVNPGDQSDFHLALQPIPPPLTGDTVQQPFPADESQTVPVVVDSGPLQVVRFSPEGEIPVAPFLSVTFNQPMVPLGTLTDLAAQSIPVQVEPALPGTWRWLGTKTLTFQYDSALIDRLPKATVYQVTVPAGTQSMTGGVLADSVEWTFTTPPPVVVSTYPVDIPQPRDPLFFVAFDQRIDPAAVLATIHVTAGNDAVNVGLASEADIQANEEVSQMVENAQEGRWLAFKALDLLPADTGITVNIGPNTPSAEGPRVTETSQSYSFYTYAPLRITDHGCSWSDNPCQPLTPFFINFNNPLNIDVYTQTFLMVEPEIPGVSVDIYGSSIQISGATQGQTTYKVTVDGDLQDIFGQKLGEDTALTFKVGPADPLLMGPGQTFETLDPAATKPHFSVYSINYSQVHVQVYAVQPSDWLAYLAYLRDWQQSTTPAQIPGRKVLDETRRIEAAADKLTQTDIDLSPYMDGKYGHFVVVVEPPKGVLETEDQQWKRYSQTVLTWVQITQIGLDAIVDHSEMVVWTTALSDGKPLAEVTVTPDQGGSAVQTGADGTARFAIPGGASYLVASQGADQALLPRSTYYWGDNFWNPWAVRDTLSWYVFDDRQMYRPGEEVHIKGWMRLNGGKQTGDVSLVGDQVQSVTYQITDPQGNSLLDGQAQVDALGGFDLVFTIPAETNLGYAQISFTANGSLYNVDGAQYYHGFQIQEFRRPEFEVTARNETSGPYFAGDEAVLAVEAKYYAGDPLPNADVTWQVTMNTGSYSPPNWPDFTFGTWQPWWYFYDFYSSDSGGDGTTQVYNGITDASGTHYLNIAFDGSSGPKPVSVIANASVMDVNRQAWASTTSLLVHPANVYVGLRSDRYFVELGTPIQVELIVTDIDGNPVAGRPVEVQAARVEWKYRGGEYQEEEVDPQACSLTSGTEPLTCIFQTPVGGTYRITATVTDDQGRQNQSQLTRWVSGGELVPSRSVEQEKVNLIPNQETYQPGDVAQILVQSPFSPAEGLLTVARSGILYTQRFQIDGGTATLSIPIEDQHVPNLNIQVDLVGAAPRTNDNGEALEGVPARPAFATGQLTLQVSTLQRTLSLGVTPALPELEPGGETNLSVVLTDAAGQPVQGAGLAVVVVDEAVLALTNYQLADPISVFYAARPSNLDSVYARSSIILVDPLSLAGEASQEVLKTVENERASLAMEAPAAAGAMPTMTASAQDSAADGAPGAAPEAINVRTDFNPLVVFAPSVTTDANGQAQVSVHLPDNLTRYRIMVVAVDSQGQRFGTGEASLTARLPLMVRPSAPRFLNFGDRFELPIILQNQTGEAMDVDVVVRTVNLDLTENSGVRVSVPAHDRVEVRFPAAALMAGTARLQIAAVSGSYADAATIELPVYTPATTEAFATYGVLDEGTVFQPVMSPTGVYPQYGGLEVDTSSTAMQALTDAVLYLVSYPFECSEQLSSRILAVASLRDVLTAFNADGMPTPDKMVSAVDRDIARLAGMQNNDGGFPYWRQGEESVPFNTIHAAHALYRAQAKGFTVPSSMQVNALAYLKDIENYYPYWYSPETRWTLSAYALYVRNLGGDRDPGKALRLIDEAGLDNLSLEAVGWLWPVLEDAPEASAQLDAVRLLVSNRVVETAGAANFTTFYSDQTYLLLSSDRRTDAILLDALIGDNPQSDLIPKLVNGLLAHRTKGHWGSTQEDVFVLLALDRYFNTFEAQTPDFVAKLWLGNTYAGDFEYHGRTTERQETSLPMTYVISETASGGGTQNLILSKEGPGRLYYRLGLRYAPTNLNLEPLDMGFVVQRRYEGVDNPEDVSQDADGVWHIKAGARVKVVITMVADNRRYHVALVDPLPAGLEIVNPDLAVSQTVPQDPSSPPAPFWAWWSWTWYNHQNLRDERAEAFTTLLWEGVYEYTYITRATTPGTFVVPPAKAEEMYSPEVFGRSSSDWVIVE